MNLVSTDYTYFYYFPTLKFKNIKFEYKSRRRAPGFDIIGYQFGKDIDNEPINERIMRFSKS